MKLATIVAVATGMVVAGALAGPVFAGSSYAHTQAAAVAASEELPPAGTIGSLTVGGGGATATPTDRLGRPLGPAVSVLPSNAAPSLSDLAAARSLHGSAVVRARAPKRTLHAASGCLNVDAWRYSTSFLFGKTVYKFHQTVHFCWSSARKLTVVNTGTYVSNVDPNWIYRGLTASNAYFFTWCCGQTMSGHYGFRQGHFDNCVLKYGCIGTEYPWVKIWVHGDGTWTYSTGQ